MRMRTTGRVMVVRSGRDDGIEGSAMEVGGVPLRYI
jgi:hypothetical protein